MRVEDPNWVRGIPLVVFMMIVVLFENPVRHIKNFNVVVGTCMGKKVVERNSLPP